MPVNLKPKSTTGPERNKPSDLHQPQSKHTTVASGGRTHPPILCHVYYQKMKIIVLYLLSVVLLLPSLWSLEPSAFFSVNRSQTADVVEQRFVQLSIQFDLSELSLGENSIAQFTIPHLGIDQMVPVTVRGSRGIFSIKLDFDSPSDINGEWSCLINSGQAANENLHFTISGVVESSMPEFPGYPQLNYQSQYTDVFVPFLSPAGIGSSISVSEAYTHSQEVSNGTVYTFPEGGPYYAEAGHRRYLSSFDILNDADQIVMTVQQPSAHSYNRIDFFVSQTPLDFNLVIEVDQNAGRLYAKGMTAGVAYQLLGSNDLTTWDPITNFTSRSNAFRHEFDIESDPSFYIMEQTSVEQDD
jgi:hypothetical protein